MSTPTPGDETRSDAVGQQTTTSGPESAEGGSALHDLLDFELVEALTRTRLNPRLRTSLSCS
jgi:hypothetical protein